MWFSHTYFRILILKLTKVFPGLLFSTLANIKEEEYLKLTEKLVILGNFPFRQC